MNEEKIIRTIYNIWLNNESRYLKFGDLRAEADNEVNEFSDEELREFVNDNLHTPEFYNLRASKNRISCSIADYKRLCRDQGRIDLTCGMPRSMELIDESELLEYLDNINALPLKDGEYHVFGKQPINIVYRGCGLGGFSSILYPVQVGQDKFYLINKKPVDEAQLDFSDLPLINLEQLKSLKEVAKWTWGGFGFYNEALDNEVEFNEFKKKHPEMNKNFDNKKFGKYFDKDGKLIPELKDEYMSLKLFDESFEKKEQTKLTESAKTWTDVYKIFNTLIDIYFPDEDKIDKAVQDVYRPHRGEEIWDEAYKRWNADLDEEEAMAYVMDESLNEDLENVEITDNTTVVPQPTGAAEEESKTLWDRFRDATKVPEDAPLFGAKKQPTPDDVKEPKAELEEALNKKSLKEGLDGWDEEKVYEVVNTCNEIYDLNYELENCVKGAYTGANTYSELADYIINLGNRLAEEGENLKYVEEDPEDEEDIDESLKEAKKPLYKVSNVAIAGNAKEAKKEWKEYYGLNFKVIPDGRFDIYETVTITGTEEDLMKLLEYEGDLFDEDDIIPVNSEKDGREAKIEYYKKACDYLRGSEYAINISGITWRKYCGYPIPEGLPNEITIKMSDLADKIDFCIEHQKYRPNFTDIIRDAVDSYVGDNYGAYPDWEDDNVDDIVKKIKTTIPESLNKTNKLTLDESLFEDKRLNEESLNEAKKPIGNLIRRLEARDPYIEVSFWCPDVFWEQPFFEGVVEDVPDKYTNVPMDYYEKDSGIYQIYISPEDMLPEDMREVEEMKDYYEKHYPPVHATAVEGVLKEDKTQLYHTTYIIGSPDKAEAVDEANLLKKEYKGSNIEFKPVKVDESTWGVDFIGSYEDVLKAAKDFKPLGEFMEEPYTDYIKPVHSTPAEKHLKEGTSKNQDYDTDEWSVIYYELSAEPNEPSYDKVLARKAFVNVPRRQKYDKVDPVNDYDLRVYAKDEKSFELAKKVANAHGLSYKIEPTNKVHASRFPQEAFQLTLHIPEEKIQSQ